MDLNHPDFQPLFDALIGMTKKLLEPQGGFLPIGAIVLPDGKVGHVGAANENERPGADAIRQLLEAGLRGIVAKQKCRAAGMSIDIRLKVAPKPQEVGKDAIWIFLEHKDGACINVYTPYAKSWLGRFTYGEAFTAPGQPRLFAKSPA